MSRVHHFSLTTVDTDAVVTWTRRHIGPLTSLSEPNFSRMIALRIGPGGSLSSVSRHAVCVWVSVAVWPITHHCQSSVQGLLATELLIADYCCASCELTVALTSWVSSLMASATPVHLRRREFNQPVVSLFPWEDTAGVLGRMEAGEGPRVVCSGGTPCWAPHWYRFMSARNCCCKHWAVLTGWPGVLD